MDERRRKSLRYLMVSIFFGSGCMAATQPYVLITLLKDLKASVFQISLVNVIQQTSMLFALPAAFVFSGMSLRKVNVLLYTASKLFFIIIPAVMLFNQGALLVSAVLCTVALQSFTGMAPAGFTQSWFKEIIPEGIRAGFLGKRSAITGVIIVLLTPLIGLLLTNNSVTDNLFAGKKYIYMALFVFAVVSGMVDMYFISKVEDAPLPVKKSGREDLDKLRQMWKDRLIWRAAFIPVVAGAGMFMIAPFMIIVFYDLGMDEFGTGVITMLSAAGSAAGMVAGGHISDRLKIRKVYVGAAAIRAAGCLLMLALTFFIYSLAPQKIYVFLSLALAAVLIAFAEGCIMSANTKYVYSTVRDGSSISFAFVFFLKSAAFMVLLMFSAKFGSAVSGMSDFLKTRLWDGFYYFQVPLVISVLLGALGGAYLCRENLYDHINRDSAEGPVSSVSGEGL